jgi:hypothetical protein
MVILGNWDGRSITLSIKENCLTVSLSGQGEADVFSYDYEGRLWTALENGVSYRRGLDGKVVAKWQLPGGGRSRRWLDPVEGLALEERARQRVKALYGAIQAVEASLDQPLPDLGCNGFERLIAFDNIRSLEDTRRYRQVYKPVGILPPDQYFSVVLQVTEGCSFNTCTFCTFYRDRPFRIKTPEALREHAAAVKEFIGAGMSLRRTIFLGDANALAAPMPRLLSLVEVVHEFFDVPALGGLYAFLDGFSGERKGIADYQALAEGGLKRVYIGLESGHDPLLRFLRKPGTAGDAVQAVRALKTAGVAVGVILLLGAGGKAYARQHIADTIRTLNAMPLDLHDLIYFSELVDQEGMDYTRDAFQAHLQPLSPDELLEQGSQIERGLKFNPKSGTPHIARYDIREFVY